MLIANVFLVVTVRDSQLSLMYLFIVLQQSIRTNSAEDEQKVQRHKSQHKELCLTNDIDEIIRIDTNQSHETFGFLFRSTHQWSMEHCRTNSTTERDSTTERRDGIPYTTNRRLVAVIGLCKIYTISKNIVMSDESKHSPVKGRRLFQFERPRPQSAGTTKSQRQVGTRKCPPPKKNISSDCEITCVLERN